MPPFTNTRTPERRSNELAWLITAPLALIALIITFALIAPGGNTGEWPAGAAFLVVFVIAASVVLIFEVRRRGDAIVAVRAGEDADGRGQRLAHGRAA